MPDIEIKCSECGGRFVLAERDQEYYQERGLTWPKRCKACRKGTVLEERFEITCGQCGKTASVPFKPKPGRPVLCPQCFKAMKASQR